MAPSRAAVVVRDGLHDLLGYTASALEAFVLDKARESGGDARALEAALIECGCPDDEKTRAFARAVCASAPDDATARAVDARGGAEASTGVARAATRDDWAATRAAATYELLAEDEANARARARSASERSEGRRNERKRCERNEGKVRGRSESEEDAEAVETRRRALARGTRGRIVRGAVGVGGRRRDEEGARDGGRFARARGV